MGSKEKTQGRLAWKSLQFVLKFRKSFKSFLQKSCDNRCKCEFERRQTQRKLQKAAIIMGLEEMTFWIIFIFSCLPLF